MGKNGRKAWWERLGRSRLAASVAEDLAGERARQELLRQAGYAGQPQGLVGRLAIDLLRALPLRTQPEDQRGFGACFDGPALLESARAEAEAAAPPPPPGGHLPASQAEPGLVEAAAWWPWHSGQRFLRLARAWLVAGDAELAQAAWQGLAAYCADNPPLMGPGWGQPWWLATRAMNWLWGLRLLSRHPGALAGLGPADPGPAVLAVLHLDIMAQVLAQVLAQEPNRPEDAGEAGRLPHDVGPAAALMHLGRCLPFLPQAAAWWELGSQALGPALKAWAEPGEMGGGLEAAMGSWAGGVAAAEMAGLGLWLGRQAGAEPPGAAQGLTRLGALCRALAPPWAPGALWGWSLEAPVLGFDPRPERAAAGAANLAALLLGEPDLRAAREVDERLYWLFGPEAAPGLRELAGGAPPGAMDWPDVGLTCLGGLAAGRRVGAFLRTGPRRPGGSPRDQAQALALALFVDGLPLLTVQGPEGGGPLAAHLGSRAGQGAVVIDGQEPGPGRVTLEGLEAGPRHLFAVASYDGYAGLADPVLLRRRVYLDLEAGLINLVDQVQAEGQHLCEALFPLPPGTKVRPAGQGAFELEGVFGRALFKPEPKAKVTLITGRGNPPLGWLALDLGRVTPAPVLRVQARMVGNARLTNVIVVQAQQGITRGDNG